ncbi:MAG: TIR domain-containing protein [Chloroflexi bacterium]|nr:MAG: TIR domain-containing protein [Chloroflexota bacterium]
MERKSVFISYRRSSSRYLARAIYQNLRQHGWDVFLDVDTIDSGDFDRIILNEIRTRAHFILLISSNSLQRCREPNDWVLQEIAEAVRLNRNIVPIVEADADFERELSYLPEALRDVVSKKNMLPLMDFYFNEAMDKLRNRFLKTPYTRTQNMLDEELAERQQQIVTLDEVAISKSVSILPPPFAWVEIPDKGYSIAKYPITNAQYRLFVEAGGYETERWWTEQGWRAREDGWYLGDNWKPSGQPWVQPRCWDNVIFNGNEQPVVCISWYEAEAFCIWLSEMTGENIKLPTKNQWEYAAQGEDSRRIYPWGDMWDCALCNNSVFPCQSTGTTKVTQYEGLGDSPFGVVDMVGNVSEWCKDFSYRKHNEPDSNATERHVKGGHWRLMHTEHFECKKERTVRPHYFINYIGFRICRS